MIEGEWTLLHLLFLSFILSALPFIDTNKYSIIFL